MNVLDAVDVRVMFDRRDRHQIGIVLVYVHSVVARPEHREGLDGDVLHGIVLHPQVVGRIERLARAYDRDDIVQVEMR